MKPVLWLFGLPCSGKTTLAKALRDHFRSQKRPVILLDGDELRSGLCADLGFSDAERSKNIRRAAHLARWLAARGNTVICAFVTPREDHRALALEILDGWPHWDAGTLRATTRNRSLCQNCSWHHF
jgi:adenylylsulfate kinase